MLSASMIEMCSKITSKLGKTTINQYTCARKIISWDISDTGKSVTVRESTHDLLQKVVKRKMVKLANGS